MVVHSRLNRVVGTCNGILSSCALGGYAMETRFVCLTPLNCCVVYAMLYRCHLGKSIVYDTVSTLSWAVDIRTHGIINVIEKILGDPWPPSVEVGREVPIAEEEEDCVVSALNPCVYDLGQLTSYLQECYSWDFGDFPP